MFTGIVEAVGRVATTRPVGEGVHLEIEAPEIARHLTIGQSVAVSGACLTVTRSDARRFGATAVGETVRRTTLGGYRAGTRVNLERGLALGDRLDGHLVQGHVDGIATVTRIDRTPPGITLQAACERDLLRYIAPKGSVALDGVSLTVVEVAESGFGVALIPHTLEVTTLGDRRAGDRVNLEVDLVARYVARLVALEGETRARRDPTQSR